MRRNRILYSISVADVQDVAEEELGRKLTDDELRSVEGRLGDGIGWRETVEAAIESCGFDKAKKA